MPKEIKLCMDRFYESCPGAVCFGSDELCDNLAPEEKGFLYLCMASEALAKITNCESLFENAASSRPGAALCYDGQGIDVTTPTRGNCEAGGVCQPAVPLCTLERYFFFLTLGYGVALPQDSEWDSSLDYFGPDQDCEFFDDGKSNDAIVCSNIDLTKDDQGRNYCDITFGGTNDAIDLFGFVLQALNPDDVRVMTFGSGENEIRASIIESIAKVAFSDEQQHDDGIMEMAFQKAVDKGCFDREGAAVHLLGHSLAGGIASIFAMRVAAEYPDVFIKMTTVDEPSILSRPIDGGAAGLQAWNNVIKDRYIAGRVMPRGQVFNGLFQARPYGLHQDYDWVSQVLPGGVFAGNDQTAMHFLCEVKNGNNLEYFIADGNVGCAADLNVLGDLPDFPHKSGVEFAQDNPLNTATLQAIQSALASVGLDAAADFVDYLIFASTLLDVEFREDFYQIFDMHFMRRPLHLLGYLYNNGADCSASRRVIALPTDPDDPPGIPCFAGDNTVETEHDGLKRMGELHIGDKIKTAEGMFDAVYSFGHYQPDAIGEYVEISIDHHTKPLFVSKEHLVLINGAMVPASTIIKGDIVRTQHGTATVKTTRLVTKSGAFAPFTMSGELLVSNILASSYVSIQNNKSTLHIGSLDSGLSLHWLAHVVQAPHRLLCRFKMCAETYNDKGLSVSAAWSLEKAQWFLNQHPLVMISVLLVACPIVLLFYALDSLIDSPWMMMFRVAFIPVFLVAGWKVKKIKKA